VPHSDVGALGMHQVLARGCVTQQLVIKCESFARSSYSCINAGQLVLNNLRNTTCMQYKCVSSLAVYTVIVIHCLQSTSKPNTQLHFTVPLVRFEFYPSSYNTGPLALSYVSNNCCCPSTTDVIAR